MGKYLYPNIQDQIKTNPESIAKELGVSLRTLRRGNIVVLCKVLARKKHQWDFYGFKGYICGDMMLGKGEWKTDGDFLDYEYKTCCLGCGYEGTASVKEIEDSDDVLPCPRRDYHRIDESISISMWGWGDRL